ncbi:MAG: hypothetical protein NC833_03285 [Candidatus Omnitrophica bacterium]|nr:hypothetical protein [Candidatus Omnitrophota bacterium]
MAVTTGELILVLQAQAGQMLSTLEQVQGKLGSTKAAGEKFGQELTTIFAKGQLLAQGFQMVIGGAVNLAKSFVESTAEMESMRAQLASIHNDTKIAGEMLGFLQQTALKTTFDLPGLIQADANLTKFGLNSVKLIPILSDLAAATKKSIEETSETVGRALQGDARYLQMLQRQFGISREELEKFGADFTENTEGKIQNLESLSSALEKYIEQNYAGAMAKQEGTLKDAWDDLNLSMKIFQSQLGEQLLPALSPTLEKITFLIQNWKVFSNIIFGSAQKVDILSGALSALLKVTSIFLSAWNLWIAYWKSIISLGMGIVDVLKAIVTFHFKNVPRAIEETIIREKIIASDFLKTEKNLFSVIEKIEKDKYKTISNYSELRKKLEMSKEREIIKNQNKFEDERIKNQKQSENEKLKNAMKFFEEQTKISKWNTNEQIYNLKRIRDKYAKTHEERREINAKIAELEDKMEKESAQKKIENRRKEIKDFLQQIERKNEEIEKNYELAEAKEKEKSEELREETRRRTEYYLEEMQKVKEADNLSLQEKIDVLKKTLEYDNLTAEARKEIILSINEFEKQIDEERRERMEKFANTSANIISNLASTIGSTYQTVIEQSEASYQAEQERYERERENLESQLQDITLNAEKRAEINKKIEELEQSHTLALEEYENRKAKATKEAGKAALISVLDLIMTEVRAYAIRGIAWAVTSAGSTAGLSLLAIPAIVAGLASAEAGVIALKSQIAALQFGTPRVPATGLYLLHEGEKIIPKNEVEREQEKNIFINLNFRIDKIEKEVDEKRLAYLISNQIALRLESLGRA